MVIGIIVLALIIYFSSSSKKEVPKKTYKFREENYDTYDYDSYQDEQLYNDRFDDIHMNDDIENYHRE